MYFCMILIFDVGKLKPVIDSEYAFEDALKAYERIMTDRAKGKVVVNVKSAESSYEL